MEVALNTEIVRYPQIVREVRHKTGRFELDKGIDINESLNPVLARRNNPFTTTHRGLPEIQYRKLTMNVSDERIALDELPDTGFYDSKKPKKD